VQRFGAHAYARRPRSVISKKELLRLPVVFVFIDPLALAILLVIDLAPFLSRECSAVGFAFRLDFVMNRSLLLLQMRCFARRERTILHAFPDPFLLVADAR
jgi:hypothetical protein